MKVYAIYYEYKTDYESIQGLFDTVHSAIGELKKWGFNEVNATTLKDSVFHIVEIELNTNHHELIM